MKLPFLPKYAELVADYLSDISFLVKLRIIEEINQIELNELKTKNDKYEKREEWKLCTQDTGYKRTRWADSPDF